MAGEPKMMTVLGLDNTRYAFLELEGDDVRVVCGNDTAVVTGMRARSLRALIYDRESARRDRKNLVKDLQDSCAEADLISACCADVEGASAWAGKVDAYERILRALGESR